MVKKGICHSAKMKVRSAAVSAIAHIAGVPAFAGTTKND
jgi:hypothetical protein